MLHMLARYKINWPLVGVITVVLAVLSILGSSRLVIETDILESLPHRDPVIRDARAVIERLPVQDRVVIDLSLAGEDRDALVEAAGLVEEALRKSGLFKSVGLEEFQSLMPALLTHVVENLPALYGERELEEQIAPLLEPERIRRAIAENLARLYDLEGIGQSELFARDPLALRNVALARLSGLAPGGSAQIYRGHLVSADGRHLLVIAELSSSGTDSVLAAKITGLIEKTSIALKRHFASRGISIDITPVGSYRAAFDNEATAKSDMRLAVTLTTIGIALLLILAFPRPLIGLLALIPSTVGTVLALFICSFIFDSVSILAGGFGGAIMAFTVDLGISYLLFLDRPQETSGRLAAREVFSSELLAVLTTVGAFLLLLFSDFRILKEIGVFSALGVSFAMVFVHSVFPRVFPTMPAAAREGSSSLTGMIDRVTSFGKYAALGALVFGSVMLLFARPQFLVDLGAMNAVSQQTLAAEEHVQRIWGNIQNKVYVMIEGGDIASLQEKSDALASRLEKDASEGKIEAAFVPSMVFPGERRAAENIAAWKAFWNRKRIAAIKKNIAAASAEHGITRDAFSPFIRMLEYPKYGSKEIPPRFYPLLGVSAQGTNAPSLFCALTPGRAYDPESFHAAYASIGAKIFDARFFSQRLGAFLSSMFLEIALIVGLGVVGVGLLFFLHLRLTGAVCAPVAVALLSTLGTLRLIGRPIDIPGIMLWIVVMGMGIDYSIYYTCSYQRYRDDRHPNMRLIRLAMFMAAATTMIGFGVLALAKHPVLRSVGFTSLLGIGYSLAGAYLILPPLLGRIFAAAPAVSGEHAAPGSRRHRALVMRRYRNMEAYPRMFARIKMRMDPMFPRLAELVGSPNSIIDIGCGYGVPAAWLLETLPDARVYALEPDGERARVAALAFGERGEVRVGRAPEIPVVPEPAEAALMIDIIHLLSDDEFRESLARLKGALAPKGRGRLILRATIPAGKRFPWKRRIEELRLRLARRSPLYRTEEMIIGLMEAAGFAAPGVDRIAGTEEVWFAAETKSPTSARRRRRS